MSQLPKIMRFGLTTFQSCVVIWEFMLFFYRWHSNICEDKKGRKVETLCSQPETTEQTEEIIIIFNLYNDRFTISHILMDKTEQSRLIR